MKVSDERGAQRLKSTKSLPGSLSPAAKNDSAHPLPKSTTYTSFDGNGSRDAFIAATAIERPSRRGSEQDDAHLLCLLIRRL
jgi:hypothetical protein